MFKFAQTLAGAATLVLALTTAAHAAPAIKVADLNLVSASSQDVLSQRVGKTASAFCREHMVTTGSRINDRSTCMSGVRAEVAAKVVATNPVSLAAR